MLSGKAIAGAIRGHFLLDAALNALLVSHTFNAPLTVTASVSSESDVPADLEEREENLSDSPPVDKDLKLAGVLYQQLINDFTMAEKVCSCEVLHSIAVKLENKKNCMRNQRITVLWAW